MKKKKKKKKKMLVIMITKMTLIMMERVQEEMKMNGKNGESDAEEAEAKFLSCLGRFLEVARVLKKSSSADTTNMS